MYGMYLFKTSAYRLVQNRAYLKRTVWIGQNVWWSAFGVLPSMVECLLHEHLLHVCLKAWWNISFTAWIHKLVAKSPFNCLVNYRFHCLNPTFRYFAITWKLPLNRVSLGFCHSICRGLRAGPAPEEPQDPRAGPGGVRLRQGRPGQCGAEAGDGDLTSEKWWLNQRKMVTQPDLTSEKSGT